MNIVLIDLRTYEVAETKLTGRQLRELAKVANDRDLFLSTTSDMDPLIDDREIVRLREGQKFYTYPRVFA